MVLSVEISKFAKHQLEIVDGDVANALFIFEEIAKGEDIVSEPHVDKVSYDELASYLASAAETIQSIHHLAQTAMAHQRAIESQFDTYSYKRLQIRQRKTPQRSLRKDSGCQSGAGNTQSRTEYTSERSTLTSRLDELGQWLDNSKDIFSPSAFFQALELSAEALAQAPTESPKYEQGALNQCAENTHIAPQCPDPLPFQLSIPECSAPPQYGTRMFLSPLSSPFVLPSPRSVAGDFGQLRYGGADCLVQNEGEI